MKCTECNFENREAARFCKKCGMKLELKCPSCSAPYDQESVFCDECGQALQEAAEPSAIDYSQPQSYTPKFLAEKILTTRSSIEGERKLVTVLFADVANYTSISEKLDPEEVHQIMDGCFKILMDEIHKYEGTINQFTGDGVMALFGAPVAHEDHAQRACHAALAIQKSIGRYGQRLQTDRQIEFKMRMGMNSGPVIVGSIGDDLRMDYTAVGDTTNLAHRMQDMAEPGVVLASGHTHRLGRDFFEFNSLGKVEVRGKEEPQEAYELIRPSEVETRIEAAVAKGLTRFVGRRKEIEALREAFESAKSGSGQVIGIVGEAGVGKSRLLLELRGMLPEGEYSYLEGRCLHYGGSMPYLPILDVLKAYFGIKEKDKEATIKEKLREKFLDLDKEADAVPPALHEVLSLTVEDEKYVQLGPQQRRERTFEAIRDLLVRESQRKPVILAIEDLHWMDKTSEEFLDYLLGFLPTTRILLILLYRPEYTHSWGSKSYYGKIGLDQLSAQTSAELVQVILEGGKVAPAIGALVLGRAGGNPLFVEELTHSLLENGSIQRQDDKYVLVQRSSEIEVPDTIHGIIAARMDRIEDNLKQIIQVASVIGREFAFRILQTITDKSEDLKASLLNLQGLEFIYEKQLFPELEYIFKHALTQEVAYNSLLHKRRKEIHEKIGKAIEELYADRSEEYYELLAYHYVRSDDKQKAMAYLDLAHQKAAKAYAMNEAKNYFDECMKLLDALPDTMKNRKHRIRLLVESYIVFMLLLRVSEYYELLARHESLAREEESPSLAGRFYGSLAYCEWYLGLYDSAIQRSKRGVELCELGEDIGAAGRAMCVLQVVHLWKGDLNIAVALMEEVTRRLSNNLDDWLNVRRMVTAFFWASLAYSMLGRWKEAMDCGREARKLATEYSDDSLLSLANRSLCFVSGVRGDLDRAIEYGQTAVENAQAFGDKTQSQLFLAYVSCRAGLLEGDIEHLAENVQMLREGQIVSVQIAHAPMLVEIYMLACKYDNARQTAEEVVELAEHHGAKYFLGWAHRLLGEIALKTNPDNATPHFQKAISIFRKIKAENELALAYVGMGRLRKLEGDVEEARKYLTDAVEIFERLGTLIEPDKVRKELADLPQ